VLYKVSRHGFHSGTPLHSGGLSLMTSPELAALMSVDQTSAELKHWEMPYAPLLQRLLEVTHGGCCAWIARMPTRPEDVRRMNGRSSRAGCASNVKAYDRV